LNAVFTLVLLPALLRLTERDVAAETSAAARPELAYERGARS